MKKYFQIRLVFLFLIFAFSVNLSFALTLKEAVENAFQNDSQVLLQRQKVVAAAETYSSAVAAAFPKLDATLSSLYKKDAAVGAPLFGGEPYNLYTAQLSLIQPLYRGGAIWAAYRFTQLNQKAEELRLEELKRSIAANTITAYLNTLQSKRQLDALTEVEKINRESVLLTEKRQRIGRSQTLDLLQSKTVLALLAPKISQAKSNLLTSTSNLAKLVNALDDAHLTLDNEIAEYPIKKEMFVHKLEELPQIERMKVGIDQSEYQSDIDLSKHYPQLSLLANIGRNTNRKADLIDDHYTMWNIGLQLQIPIFSGLSSFADRKVSAAKKEEASLGLEEATRVAKLNAIVSTQELDNARAIYISSIDAFDLAKKSLEEAKKNYRYSTIDYAQYLSIQQNFLDARIALDQAKVAIWLVLNKHMSAMGHTSGDFINIYELALKGDVK